MKKNKQLYVIFICLLLLSETLFSQGQFRIKNDPYVQIGYSTTNSLTFGQGTSTPNNGNFALEYCLGCSPAGFNVWKPWPTAGSGNYFLFIRNDGRVGIGTSGDASFKLFVNGSVRVTALLQTSDESVKKNFAQIQDASNLLNSLTTYSYFYINSEHVAPDSLSVNVSKTPTPLSFDDNQHFGFKAQEFQEILPSLVVEGEDGIKNINYIELIPFLVKANQEQQAQIDQLKEELQQLKNTASTDEAMMNAPKLSTDEVTFSSSKNILYQNVPNPFNQATTIQYKISENTSSAKICLYNLNGTQLKCFNLDKSGSVEIRASSLKAGIYLYTLIVDNSPVDTKRMILTE
ncbi:MAG: T9SS type A sorting domain-containing protein [Bacteroidales bacterium]|jgi:hypothetical protein|nr:T9SS type A sorting domain-containing protein [Bacteroidales bacterium]